MFCPWQIYHARILFESKAGAYLRRARFRCSSLGYATGLACKLQTRLEWHAKNKHSSLIEIFINYVISYNACPWWTLPA